MAETPEDHGEFQALLKQAFATLFDRARKQDELSFLFAILGINSGMEDAGWQPIGETVALTNDLIALLNTPLEFHTKARLALLLYSHVTEASYMYHCIWNLMLEHFAF